jgi:hypothetical protein
MKVLDFHGDPAWGVEGLGVTRADFLDKGQRNLSWAGTLDYQAL